MSAAPFGSGPNPLGGPIGGPIWGYGSGAYGTGGYGGGQAPNPDGGEEAPRPDLMLQTVVTLAENATEGQVIEAVSIAWFKIVDELLRDASLMNEIPWRRWEEMIAGAYDAEGWDEVILTPRSGDGGRDVIATRRDFGSIRIIEQVKAYAPGRLLTANDVRALLGVLHADPNASKGIVTTTSGFAPGIYDDQAIIQYMPNRLDLRPGDKLIEWLARIRAKKGI